MRALGGLRQGDGCKFEASQGYECQATLGYLETLSQRDRERGGGEGTEGGKEGREMIPF